MNNSFAKKTSTVLAVHCLRSRGGSRGGDCAIASLKTYESNFATMISYNSEKSIRDIRSFCRPLFCHRAEV